MSTSSIPPRRAGAHRPGSVDLGARVNGWLPDGVHVVRRSKGRAPRQPAAVAERGSHRRWHPPGCPVSADLEIPAAAYTAAADAIDRYAAEHHGQRVAGKGAVALIVSAAAPIVVAAELRRMADRIGPQTGIVDGSDSMTRRACAADLRARADELAPAAPDDAAEVDAAEAGPMAASTSTVQVPRNLLQDIACTEPCWFDHNGECQAHGFSLLPGEVCPMEQVKTLLDDGPTAGPGTPEVQA